MTTEDWGRPPHQPNEEAVAEKHTGATSKILRGEQKPPFGIGTLGVATQEKITVSRGGKTHEKDLVAKFFTQRTGLDSLSSAMTAFRNLKEAGVKHIPTTYRKIGPDEVLMTDYNRGGKVAVGGNRNEKAENLRVTSITNLPELLMAMGKDLQCATNAKISIFTDSYFFIIPASGGDAEADFVIGDLGGVGLRGKFDDNRDWHEANIERAQKALQSFVFWHVAEGKQDEYQTQIKAWSGT